MKKKHKKANISAIVLSIILVAVLGFATLWIALNYDALKSTIDGTKLYTQEEVQEAYNKGLEDKQGYEAQITEWINKYEETLQKLNNANEKMQKLNESNELNKNEIKELQSLIQQLNNDIDYYSTLLEQYNTLTEKIVTFYVDEELVQSNIVMRGECVTEVPVIENTEHMTFIGWSIDGTTIVEPTTIEINENTRFIAVVEIKYSVTFVYKDSVVKTESVLQGQYATEPTEELAGLQGWSIDGTTIVDIANYEITEDITFIAVYNISFDAIIELNEDLVANNSNTFTVEGLKTTSNFELKLGFLRIEDTYDSGLPIWNFNGVLENGKKLVFSMGENSVEITATCLTDGVMTISYNFVGPAIADDFSIKMFRFDEIKIKN